ncbi:hypothetical protein Tco_1518441 [Tanacetum coccineum]
MWSLDHLSVSVPSRGLYKTKPQSLRVIKTLIQVPQQGQENRTKNKKTIVVGAGNIKPNGNSQVVKGMHGVFQIRLWALWKWRNILVNASTDLRSRVKDEDIFPTIQRLSKTWIAARLALKLANRHVWIASPFNLFV